MGWVTKNGPMDNSVLDDQSRTPTYASPRIACVRSPTGYCMNRTTICDYTAAMRLQHALKSWRVGRHVSVHLALSIAWDSKRKITRDERMYHSVVIDRFSRTPTCDGNNRQTDTRRQHIRRMYERR